MVAGGCVIVMEILYKMDFSLPGFLICAAILGFGMNASFFFDSFLFVMKTRLLRNDLTAIDVLVLMIICVTSDEFVNW